MIVDEISVEKRRN